jgi:hypothetical protein
MNNILIKLMLSLFSLLFPLLFSSSPFSKHRQCNPFVEAFPDPLCKLNLKETFDFVSLAPPNEQQTKDFRPNRTIRQIKPKISVRIKDLFQLSTYQTKETQKSQKVVLKK